MGEGVMPSYPRLLAVLLVFAVFFAAWTADAAASDRAELARYAPRFERLIAAQYGTRCPHVHYVLRAEAVIETAFPGEDVPAAASGCIVWFGAGEVTELTVAHELLHTAGFAHGPAMDEAIWLLLYPPASNLNRRVGSGSLRGMKIKARKSKTNQPKVRSGVAIDAHMRNSAGSMGGTRRAQRRRDRQDTKRALRAGSED